MKLETFVVLIMLAFASEQKENDAETVATSEQGNERNDAKELILVKIEEDEYTKNKTPSSKYIGITYIKRIARWAAYRRSKKKLIHNGSYKDEETAAHASDTVARKLMANGEQNRILNFPDDESEVYPENRTKSSNHIGVYYNEKDTRWVVQRWSKNEKKVVLNGSYKAEETAAHASDTLARTLMQNGDQSHELNFPADETNIYAEKTGSSQYIGVSFHKNRSYWSVQRRSKNESKMAYNGCYDTEEEAAHASDILARKLIKNGEKGHKLNFPDDDTENKKKRKRSDDLENLKNN